MRNCVKNFSPFFLISSDVSNWCPRRKLDDLEMKKKGITPMVSPAYGRATLGHAENVYIRNVPWTNIFLLLTLTAISLPSNFQEWKAVRISNYAETFPLCITAQSRISAHYTNSSDALVRGPLKHGVPLLPARFPPAEERRQREMKGWRLRCWDALPFPALPSRSLPSSFAPMGVSGLAPHLRIGSFGMMEHFQMLKGTQHPVLSAQGQASQRSSFLLDCWELLRDARRFTESQQGWSQVTLTPEDQAAASQGKCMPT